MNHVRRFGYVVGSGLLIACSSSKTPPISEPDASSMPDGGEARDAAADVIAEPIIDKDRLGPACSTTQECESGLEDCYDFVGVGLREKRCVDGDPCSVVTCPAGKTCAVQAEFPGKIYCIER